VNEISTQELSRKLSLSIEDLALAIGWLARENNIYITRKNGLLYVSNGIKSNMYY
ncbi:winged helix-turn-helix domain-containing protein, partial [Parabacteroides distasonis]